MASNCSGQLNQFNKNEIKDVDKVQGKAILNFNKKRSEWGWKSIEVQVVYD